MSGSPLLEIKRLGPDDVAVMRSVNALFSTVFEEPENYRDHPPNDAYLQTWLSKLHVITLAALQDGAVIGALVAYELEKFEQARSEIYIYDLAVDEGHRRRGIASALIARTQEIAAKTGAWVVFVQADQDDPPAVALYSKLGVREDVLHFDLPVRPTRTQK